MLAGAIPSLQHTDQCIDFSEIWHHQNAGYSPNNFGWERFYYTEQRGSTKTASIITIICVAVHTGIYIQALHHELPQELLQEISKECLRKFSKGSSEILAWFRFVVQVGILPEIPAQSKILSWTSLFIPFCMFPEAPKGISTKTLLRFTPRNNFFRNSSKNCSRNISKQFAHELY